MRFAKLISGRIYFEGNRTSLNEIMGVYAPKSTDWADKVARLMNEYSRKLADFTPYEPTIIDDVSASAVISFIPPIKVRGEASHEPEAESAEPVSEDSREMLQITPHFYAEPLTKDKKRGILNK